MVWGAGLGAKYLEFAPRLWRPRYLGLRNVVYMIKTIEQRHPSEQTHTSDTHHDQTMMGCVMDKNGGDLLVSGLADRLVSCTARADDARRTAANTRKTATRKKRGKRRRTAASTGCTTRVVIMGMGMGRNVEQNRAEVARHGHGSMCKEQACQEHDKSSPRHDGQRVASKKLGPIDWHRTA